MKSRSAAALVVATFALSACGADPSSNTDVVATVGSPVQDSNTNPAANINNFVAKTVSGETFVLSNALAQKPVVLWFWAPG
ncbi:MAG: hypothetical protein WCP83_07960 [Actinomycetota bacterium]